MAPDEGELKTYIIKRLESTSDADPEVLCEYVFALLKADAFQPTSKASYTGNLQDFLGDNTNSFLDDLFLAISTQSFDSSRPLLKPTAATFQPARRASAEKAQSLTESRKRSYQDWDENANENGQMFLYQGDDRPVKLPKRGGRIQEQRVTRQPLPPVPQYGGPQQPSLPPLPTPPPGMPPFDQNSAVATLLAMQQAMGLLPSLPNGTAPPNGYGFGPPSTGQRCRDYDIKGFCAAGASCPYEHGNDTYVFPNFNQEYDPNDAALLDVTPIRVGQVEDGSGNRGRRGAKGRGRARGHGSSNWRGGNKRASFSQTGPNRDPAITAIVVEQIPPNKCDEQSVHDFFSEFGNIQEITIQPENNLAIVKFDEYQAARAAYESPKVVFDNRFVKVFWLKSNNKSDVLNAGADTTEEHPNGKDVEMVQDYEVNLGEITKRQEEAQRKHEAVKQQREEAEKQRQDLEAKIKAIDAERKRMADVIAKKSSPAASATNGLSTHGSPEESEQTRGLKQMLDKLAAEAETLGIDPEAAANKYNNPPSYRGRGGYRGRGRGRGRGYYPSYRGAWNGRGGAVMRLDNRPKTVAVTFAGGNYENHDEALRQFLLFNSLDSASLEKHPHQDDTALLTFQHRYEGENFIQAAANSDILHIGKVELSWYKPDEKAANGTAANNKKTGPDAAATQAVAELTDAQTDDMVEEEDLDRWA